MTGEIRGIQFLRAIAALMVVAHHARQFVPVEHWTNVGGRGVDVFFVISGFIMAHATRGFDPTQSKAGQAADFLRRRFVRVVPLYWLALLWTAGGVDRYLLLDFAFVPHFHPYFTDSIFPTLLPGWTINYEVFFYALFAASLFAGRARYAVLAAALCSLVLIGTLTAPTSATGIFYTHTILLEFVFGIAVYAALQRWPRPLPMPLAAATSAASFVLLAIDNGDALRGFLDGTPAALLVWSFVQWTSNLRLQWLHALGDASYSIYLFHLATFALSGWALSQLGIGPETYGQAAFAITSQIAFAAGCGWLIHRLLERPFLRAMRRKRSLLPRREGRAV